MHVPDQYVQASNSQEPHKKNTIAQSLRSRVLTAQRQTTTDHHETAIVRRDLQQRAIDAQAMAE